jgi:uncharacterized RDD family membrane protein YckC
MWKRISAYLFDIILLAVVTAGVAFILSAAFNYEGVLADRDAIADQYEKKYNVDFDISYEDYNKLSEEERLKFDEVYKEFTTDPAVSGKDLLLFNLTILIASFSLLIAYILLEAIVPLKLKNGQTIGKKIFGIAVMRVDGVRINTLQLFIRTVLGKYTVETMIPIFLIFMLFVNYMPLFCVVGLLLVALIQIVFVATTRLRFAIHDAISGTVCVDLASQLIFDTPEELLEYKKKVHAEAAEKADYR